MAEGRYAPFQRALLAAATRKQHLAVLAATLLGALGMREFELGGLTLPVFTLLLGVSAYVAMVALDVTNPEFVARFLPGASQSVAPAEQPVDPKTLRDAEIRGAYVAILNSLSACRNVYASTSEGLRASLEDGLRRSEELVQVAGRAARRADAIRRHLDTDTEDAFAREQARLHELAARTADETARDGFLQAAAAKQKELDTFRQLQGLRDRIHAQLKLIEASLDGLAAKLVKLEATDLAEAVSINEAISENVRNVTSDVEILEASYDEAIKEFRA